MPLQNRVTPLGELIADPARGLVYGNRGCLHDATGRIRRRYNGKRWIACRLEFRGLAARRRCCSPARSRSSSSSTRRPRSPPGTARARSAAARTTTGFCAIWSAISSRPGRRGRDRRAAARRALDASAPVPPFDELPDGAFVLERRRAVARARRGASSLDAVRLHGATCAAPSGTAVVITPPSLVAVLRAGWHGAVPFLHPSARPS